MHFLIPSFVFFTLLSLLLTPSSSSSDFRTLLSLQQTFNQQIPNWNASNQSSLCFSWTGIQCLNGRVTSLDLTDMGLGGTVPREISRLSRLSRLSLAGNNFTGDIDIGNIANLEFLNISNNQFSGGLADWDFTQLPNLEVLDANNNNFTSLLPLGVLELKERMRHLDLGGNFFFGKVPAGYGGFEKLEFLFLGGNDLDGAIPRQLGNLTTLKELYLGYYNVWEGGIPIELGNLKNLVHLDISNCGLRGSIPRELGKLESLDTLYLHINQLSGSIPRELGNLTSLAYLDLSNNALIGEIPAEFSSLNKIILFNLFLNRLHGSVPDYLAEFPRLVTLSLWMNNFTGTIPAQLGTNSSLETLDLSSNKLTGTIPDSLCSSNQLRILILFKNFLFGPIPAQLGVCLTLTRIRLGQNYLNGTIPNNLIFLPNINLLEIQDNYLSGNITGNANGSISNLAQLDLSNNQISGSLPSSISNLTSLEIMLLAGNQFSGSIPRSISHLRSLTKLDLSRNSLAGPIPPQISECDHLNYLDLSQNNLTDTIPPEISHLQILNYLNLSRNHLIGPIPASIAAMRSLSTADFTFNPLLNTSSFAGEIAPLRTPNPRKNKSKLIFALGMLAFSLTFAAAAVIKNRSRSFTNPSDSWKMTTFGKVEFTARDIQECMKDGNVIGRGGAGIVYHGKIGDGVEIAIKKLLGFGCNDHGFRAEIETLGKIRHRNIVRLVAFCTNKNTNTNLLVYEYMRNGSLGEALHGKKGGFLGWRLRYKVALEAAKGLGYLHHDCVPMIIHRDVKSNNILLDSSFEAHVADFGLARFMVEGGGASQCMSAIAGSYGYIAPEYAYTLQVDEKSDVYSFGVVLLELITGHRPVGEFGEGVDIVQWSKLTTGGRMEEVSRIIDTRLATVPQAEAVHLYFVALLCVQENSVERPTMREVVQMISEFPRPTRTEQQPPSSSRVGCQVLKS